jgi:hypothetical protein
MRWRDLITEERAQIERAHGTSVNHGIFVKNQCPNNSSQSCEKEDNELVTDFGRRETLWAIAHLERPR